MCLLRLPLLRTACLLALTLTTTSIVAGTRTVVTTQDSGPGSLRQAIADADPGDTITFSLPPKSTIQLTSAALVINKDLIITGPGASELTVAGTMRTHPNCCRPRYSIFAIAPVDIDVAISGLTISDGGGYEADKAGGVLNESTGSVLLKNCVITDNLVTARGAGICNHGTLTVDGCTISENRVADTRSADNGAGIFNDGTLIVSNSTVTGNSVRGMAGGPPLGANGGGICNKGALTVVNSTISGNDASFKATAGGIANVSGRAILKNATISNNSSDFGGGSLASYTSAETEILNSIVASNLGNPETDVTGRIHSLGHNLIGRSRATIVEATGDQIGTVENPLDAKLGPLQDNGGPTATHALLTGSTAIDKGKNADGLPTDQRGPGFSRRFDDPANANAHGGDGTDIGAFEVQTSTEQPSNFANISTRVRIGTGDNVLIGGFIIGGTQTKKVLIRAIGPSLPGSEHLEDPTLELFGPSGLIDANDNWVDSSDRQKIEATTIPPGRDLESAIIAELPAHRSGYTAVVRGLNETTGVGLVEIYDLDASVNSTLANISTRSFVQTDDNVMIGGIIVRGQTPSRVIVRALGPSLGMSEALADPTLELRDQNGGLLQFNDNWRSDQEAEIVATAVQPSSDLEPAIVRNLAPANYTAIVRGVSQSTGIAVVEAYDLP